MDSVRWAKHRVNTEWWISLERTEKSTQGSGKDRCHSGHVFDVEVPIHTRKRLTHSVFFEVAPGAGLWKGGGVSLSSGLSSPSLPASVDFNRFVSAHYRKHLRIDLLLGADSILRQDGWRTAKNIAANRCPIGLFSSVYLTLHGSTSPGRHWKNALPGSV